MGGLAPSVVGPLVQSQISIEGRIMRWEVLCLPSFDLAITDIHRGQDYAMGGDAPSVVGPLVPSQAFMEGKSMLRELRRPSISYKY